jgi:hypothetical protein
MGDRFRTVVVNGLSEPISIFSGRDLIVRQGLSHYLVKAATRRGALLDSNFSRNFPPFPAAP